MVEYFLMQARYNRLANQRVIDACTQLSDEDFRRDRFGSYRTIHRTLNHILLSDRTWLARFESVNFGVRGLDTVLFDDLPAFAEARVSEDKRIERFVGSLSDRALRSVLHYRNSAGKPFSESLYLLLGHFFNHQTHHRGQIHAMLSQTHVKPISLDMHRMINLETQAG